MSSNTIGYNGENITEKDDIEKYKEAYGSVLEDLDEQIEILKKEITNLADQLVELQKVHNNPLSISKGKFVSDFESKCSEVFLDLSNKFIYYSEKQAEVNEMRDKVQEKYEESVSALESVTNSD